MIGKWTKSVWKLYMFAQIFPIILFKRKDLKKRPLFYLWKVLAGFSKSMAFILMHGVMTSFILCRSHELNRDRTNHPFGWALLIAPHTASIFLENPGRIEEIMLWVLPRYMSLMWNLLKKTKLINGDVPFFENLIFGLSIGLLVHCYVNNGRNMKSKYKTIACSMIDSEDLDKVEQEVENVKYKFGQAIDEAITRADADSTATMHTIKTCP